MAPNAVAPSPATQRGRHASSRHLAGPPTAGTRLDGRRLSVTSIQDRHGQASIGVERRNSSHLVRTSARQRRASNAAAPTTEPQGRAGGARKPGRGKRDPASRKVAADTSQRASFRAWVADVLEQRVEIDVKLCVLTSFKDKNLEKDFVLWNNRKLDTSTSFAVMFAALLVYAAAAGAFFVTYADGDAAVACLAVHGVHTVIDMACFVAVLTKAKRHRRTATMVVGTLCCFVAIISIGAMLPLMGPATPRLDAWRVFAACSYASTMFIAIEAVILRAPALWTAVSGSCTVLLVAAVGAAIVYWKEQTDALEDIGIIFVCMTVIPVFALMCISAKEEEDCRDQFVVLRKHLLITNELALEMETIQTKEEIEENKPHNFEIEMLLLHNCGLEQTNHRTPTEVPRAKLTIGKRLGVGAFGLVHKATVDDLCTTDYTNKPLFHTVTEVAAKMAKAGHEAESQATAVANLLEEATVMAQFSHENVLKLHGVCTSGIQRRRPPVLVLELCEHGTLQDFLHASKTFRVLTILARLAIANDIVEGMIYLSNAGFVHRDLASRNVLVNAKYVCKISDFGMAKTFGDEDFYVAKAGAVPVRWTAVEALKENKFSTSSDVWSFGITLYEVFTDGQKPYKEFKTNQEVWNNVASGYRLACPKECPDAVWSNVIFPCWEAEADARPTFEKLAGVIYPLLKLQRQPSEASSTVSSQLDDDEDDTISILEMEIASNAQDTLGVSPGIQGLGSLGNLSLMDQFGSLSNLSRPRCKHATASNVSLDRILLDAENTYETPVSRGHRS